MARGHSLLPTPPVGLAAAAPDDGHRKGEKGPGARARSERGDRVPLPFGGRDLGPNARQAGESKVRAGAASRGPRGQRPVVFQGKINVPFLLYGDFVKMG